MGYSRQRINPQLEDHVQRQGFLEAYFLALSNKSDAEASFALTRAAAASAAGLSRARRQTAAAPAVIAN